MSFSDVQHNAVTDVKDLNKQQQVWPRCFFLRWYCLLSSFLW